MINEDHNDRRIDNFLVKVLKGVPRVRVYRLLRKGEIRVNGGRIKQGYRLQTGDIVRLPPVNLTPDKEPIVPREYLLEMIQNNTIYEDNDLIVLNKPSGIVVHGGTGRSFGVIEILRHLRGKEEDLQLVHRLDRETSGCLIIAKRVRSLKILNQLLKSGNVEKHYTALLCGKLDRPVMDVRQPLSRDLLRSGERLVQVSETGKQALTHFRTIKLFDKASLVDIRLMTGRTHQIRVHSQYIEHPVAGDKKYGDKESNKLFRQLGLKRLFLHAARLTIPAIDGHGELKLSAPLPDDLQNFLHKLT